MAKAVQKKIAEKGQDPKHILENEWPEILENIYEDILQQLRDKGILIEYRSKCCQ